MEINLSTQLANRITLVSTPPEIKNWQTGQMLKAVAANNSQNGQVTLLIGRIPVEAKTPLPIQSGQTLTLEVTSKGELPILRIVPESSNKPVIEQAIRQNLPRQASQTTLLANLTTLAQLSTGNQKEVLPATILQAIRSFLKTLPEPRQVSNADGLRNSFRNSGSFLEAKLANPSTPTLNIRQDLKGALLRLDQQIKDSYRSITRDTGAAPGSRQGTPVSTGTPAGTASTTTAAATSQKATETTPQAGGARESSVATEDRSKLAATVIREPSTQQKPAPATTATRSTLPGQATGTGIAGSTTQGQATPATSTTAPSADELLRSIPVAREHAPPMRNGILQAQARADATLNHQDTLSRILATLIKDTDSSLARMQLSQLASQPVEGDQRQVWLLELPIRKDDGIDLFQFRIEREEAGKQAQEQDQDRWTVRFAFSLQGLGPVYARISILGDTVSTTIWVEQEETARLFNQHKETLEQNLLRSGLVIEQFSFINGKPAHDMGFSGRPSEQILSEKA